MRSIGDGAGVYRPTAGRRKRTCRQPALRPVHSRGPGRCADLYYTPLTSGFAEIAATEPCAAESNLMSWFPEHACNDPELGCDAEGLTAVTLRRATRANG